MIARYCYAALAGGAVTLSMAPFGLFPLDFVSLGVLAWLLGRAGRGRDAFLLGLAWGLGAFGSGVSWLYIALARYGGVPPPLAALAIALFCAFLALYPALVALAFARLRIRCALTAPAWSAALFGALWLFGEWLRGVMFTGFPWLAVGYAQTPPSPFAGLLPVVGVYGVGAAVAALAAWFAFAGRAWRMPLAGLAVAALAGAGLGRVGWTEPQGEPLAVALLQTNVAQSLKWDPAHFVEVLRTNAQMVRDNPAALVVLPETTLPALADQLPVGYLDGLGGLVRAQGGDVVLGVFLRDEQGRIYNAAASFGSGATQTYAKRHLVPFGEYSPPLFGWFYRLANIPMSDQTRGEADQPPMLLGGQRVAINICYEDLFGAELIGSLPQATLMLNLSNLAWYGDSLAQPQHLQIARVRALETGRPMLRATNTGMTAVIRPDGSVAAALPAFERGALHAEVRGHVGLTPYARWGDRLALGIGAAVLLGCVLTARRRAAVLRAGC